MNLLKEIATRNAALARKVLPARLRKFSASLGDRLALAGGEFQSADTGKQSATFVISTSTQDRDGDIMVPSGCQLEAYRKNPIVLWDHQSDENPIGLSESDGQLQVKIESNRIVATCFFHCKTARSAETYTLVADGIIRGASIGFLPLPGGAKKNHGGKGYTFDGWELTEWSVTPLGANSEALRHRLDSGRVKSLRSVLEPYAAKAKKNWSNGVEIKAMADDKDDELDDLDADKPEGDDPTPDDIEKDEDLDTETDLDDETETDTEADETPSQESAPKPGARALGEVAAACDVVLERLTALVGENEHPEVVSHLTTLTEHFGKVAQETKDVLASLYPDIDPASVMPNLTDDVPPEGDVPPVDDEIPDEEMTKGKKLKRLSKAVTGCVKEASEFLKDLGDDATIPPRYKAGCRHHSKSLGDMLAGMEKPEAAADEPKEDELPPEAVKALVMVARKVKRQGAKA
jgi:hypothetical protein